jgi:hypothetical protein
MNAGLHLPNPATTIHSTALSIPNEDKYHRAGDLAPSYTNSSFCEADGTPIGIQLN